MKHQRVHIACVITVMILMFSGSLPIRAAKSAVEVNVEVSQILEGDFVNVGDTFSYILTPEVSNHPLPFHSEGNYTFTIEGNDTVQLPAIEYDTIGTYIYHLALTNQETVNGLILDPTVFTIEVYITVNRDRELVSHTIVKDADHLKVANIGFMNRYEMPSGSRIIKLPSTGLSEGSYQIRFVLIGIGIAFLLAGSRKERKRTRDF